MTKKQKRPQAQKPVVRSRSIETMEFMLRGQGGTHKAKTDYRRKPKHSGRGWDE